MLLRIRLFVIPEILFSCTSVNPTESSIFNNTNFMRYWNLSMVVALSRRNAKITYKRYWPVARADFKQWTKVAYLLRLTPSISHGHGRYKKSFYFKITPKDSEFNPWIWRMWIFVWFYSLPKLTFFLILTRFQCLLEANLGLISVQGESKDYHPFKTLKTGDLHLIHGSLRS